jgi:glycosyltransferase involved in cell wall biosynthesis
MKTIVHIVEPDPYHEWFKKLIANAQDKSIYQEVITFRNFDDLNKFAKDKKISIYPHNQKGLRLYLKLLLKIRSIKSRNKSSVFVAQGHKPSFICLVAKHLLRLDYGIIHHIQPGYFELLKKQNRFKGRVHQSIYNAYLTRASFVQSLSLEVSNYLLSIDIPKERIFHSGHGIDFETFKEKISEKGQKELESLSNPRILMVGRLVWEKNYMMAFTAMSQLTKHFPDAQLIVAGTGPDEELLRRTAEELDLQQNVHFLGWVSNIPKLMAECDLMLHLALTESYGQVIIEACLSNLPVFTFPTGVSIDLKEQGDPLINIISSQNPEIIGDQLAEYFSRPRHKLSKSYDPYVKYLEHNQDVIVDKITDYLRKM